MTAQVALYRTLSETITRHVFGVSDRVTHKPGLKFRIYGEEEFYYPCSENKGADQLCSLYQLYLNYIWSVKMLITEDI